MQPDAAVDQRSPTPPLPPLQTTIALPSLLPLAVPSALDEQAIRREFNTRISYNIPREGSSRDNQIAVQLKTRTVFLDMHKISLPNSHYLATSLMCMISQPRLLWSVLAEQKPGLIVKLTNDVATSFRQLYWPKRVGESFQWSDPGAPVVTYLSEEKLSKDLVKRVMQVAKDSNTFNVTILDYLSWQDFGVPALESFTALLDAADVECPETSPERRIVVHCGAGIGRTGTFIAAHAARKIPADQRTATLFYDLVMSERQQRQKPMVETAEQYLLMHKAIRG